MANKDEILIALQKVNQAQQGETPLDASSRTHYLQWIKELEQDGHVNAIPVLVETARVFSFDADICKSAQRASKKLSPIENKRDPYGVFRI